MFKNHLQDVLKVKWVNMVLTFSMVDGGGT